mgnify:CR=1 FL=1
MVEIIRQGAYLLDGQIVPAGQAQGQPAPDKAREKTIAYSILRAHNRGEDPGKLRLIIQSLISHYITFACIVQSANASGL